MPYLLDTNICVFFLRGKLNLDELIRKKELRIVLFRRLLLLNFAMVQKTATIQLNRIKL
jgi:hypothetical protein